MGEAMRDYEQDPSLGRVKRQVKPRLGRSSLNPSISHPLQSTGVAAGPVLLNGKTAAPATLVPIRLSSVPTGVARSALVQLQQMIGNRCVQRVLRLSSDSEGDRSVDSSLERTIESTRGGGQSLDRSTQATMGKAFSADFSSVRVHTNSQADSLNQSLNARAFTTGQDIYFRQGAYSPGSSSGKELLAHELTHVVQQNGDKIQGKSENQAGCSGCADNAERLSSSIQAKLTVSRPGDVYEQEADRAGQAFAKWEQQGSQASKPEPGVQRQAVEEEKKEESPLMAKAADGWLLRQPEAGIEEEKEEESVQAKYRDDGLQRQAEEEEEPVT